MIKKTVFLLVVMVFIGSMLFADMTVDQLVDKCIKAAGGKEAFKAINTMKITAKLHVQGMELQLTGYLKRPLMGRVEVIFQGMQIINAFNDTLGWSINPMQGETEAKKIPEETYIRLKEELTIDSNFIDYKKKGHQVELMGKEDLEGVPVYKVKMIMKSGKVNYLFIDTEYFLVVKQKSKVKRGENEFESEQTVGDYKEVSGLMMAHSTETKVNNKTVEQTTIEKVEVNVPLDDQMFQMPEKKKETSPEKKEQK